MHPGGQGLAPGGVPRCLTAGVQASATALLPHVGLWVQPPRRQATGPVPTPRGMPWPPRLSAQVINGTRQWRLVRVRHRVVFGARSAVEPVRAAPSWHLNTAFIARLTRTIRPPGAAVGRRVLTRCPGEEG